MKTSRLILTTVLGLAVAFPALAKETGTNRSDRSSRLYRSMGPNGPNASIVNINNLTIWLDRDAFFDWTLSASGSAGEYPKGTAGLIFAEGMLWGVKVDDGEIPRLRVNGSTYATGLKAGKVLYDANGVVTGSEDFTTRHLWRVRSDYATADLTADAASFFVKAIGGVTDADVAEVFDQYDYDWNNWPVGDGAPFEDVDGNGVYDPTVDVPGFPGASQTVWTVVNDLPILDEDGSLNSISETSYGSPPIGMEMQLTIWEYDFATTNPLGNMMFKEAKIIYTGLINGRVDAKLDTVYFTQWSDPDLGDFGDDFVGSDTTLSLGYVYNGNATDGVFLGQFGLPVPAGGYDFLQGPIVDGDTLGMTVFNYFAAGSPISDPDLAKYDGTLQWYNLMEGFLPRPEYPTQEVWVDDQGNATKFTLAGIPETGTGDIDGVLLPPGDRRLTMTSGPFSMALGDTQTVVIALVAAMGSDALSSLAKLRDVDKFAQLAFDNDFELWAPPAGPQVTGYGGDGTVNLYWGHSLAAVALTEDAVSRGMVFEGYNVFQLPSASSTPDEGLKIASFDVINGIKTVLELIPGPELGIDLEIVAQEGTDSGISRSLLLTFDAIRNRPMSNDIPYFFGVSAYSVYDTLSDAPGAVVPPFKHLEGSLSRATITPQTPDLGMALGADVGAKLAVTHKAGASDGVVQALVIDPSALNDHNYQVTFAVDEDTNSTTFGETLWTLTDLTTGKVKLADQSQAKDLTTDVSQLIVDGVQVAVQGPPPDFKNFEMVANAAGPIDPPEAAALDFQGFPTPGGANPDDPQQVGDGHWAFHTGDDAVGPSSGSRGSYSSFLSRSMRGDNFDRAVPFDFEMRFTVEGSYAVQAFTTGNVVTVPFELWNIGLATPDDATDDYRMIPWFLELDAVGSICLNCNEYTLEPNDHSASGGDNDPFTPWIYWLRPEDFSAGTAGYDAFVASLDLVSDPPTAEPPGGSYAYDGAEVIARSVLVNWNGGSVADPATFRSTVNQLVPEEGSIIRITTTKPNGVSDVFTFTAPASSSRDSLVAVDLDKINVFPNPYYGFHILETSRDLKWVKFINLPAKATIRIFNLGGTMVKVLEKDDPTQYMEWNLTNQADFPVASGIYIAHIEMDEGTKILKLAIVQEEQILVRY